MLRVTAPAHPESLRKSFLPPVRVHALIEFEGIKTKYTAGIGMDKESSITVHFHKRRITEDQDLYVREGDFLLYGDIYYEIVTLEEPNQLFGQIEHRFEIKAECSRARDGVFNAN